MNNPSHHNCKPKKNYYLAIIHQTDISTQSNVIYTKKGKKERKKKKKKKVAENLALTLNFICL